MNSEDSTPEAWPDFAFNYTHSVQFASTNETYANENDDAVTVIYITVAIIYFLLMQVAYLIYQNLYTWSAVMQAKHLKMLRDREYVLLRAYKREMQFSRLMQEIAEDEEQPEEATTE
ncbi:Callose synthase [Dirofilaria immitis]